MFLQVSEFLTGNRHCARQARVMAYRSGVETRPICAFLAAAGTHQQESHTACRFESVRARKDGRIVLPAYQSFYIMDTNQEVLVEFWC